MQPCFNAYSNKPLSIQISHAGIDKLAIAKMNYIANVGNSNYLIQSWPTDSERLFYRDGGRNEIKRCVIHHVAFLKKSRDLPTDVKQILMMLLYAHMDFVTNHSSCKRSWHYILTISSILQYLWQDELILPWGVRLPMDTNSRGLGAGDMNVNWDFRRCAKIY